MPQTRILLVDDDNQTLRMYEEALLRAIKPQEQTLSSSKKTPRSSLKVESADTVELAFEKLRAQQFEILVVDLKIPGLMGDEMGGLEVISESIGLDPLRPIIVITGFGSVELARKTLTQGVFDFIEKSSKAVADLISSIRRAIDHYDEKILRSGNPFTPMSGVEPTVFGGRAEELAFFDEKLSRSLHGGISEHFVVLGDWGIGKSSLLKEYKKICQTRGHIATLVPCEPLGTGSGGLADAARSIVEAVLRDLPYPANRLKKLTEYLNSVGISVIGTGFQVGWDTSQQRLLPQAFLHEALTKLWQDLQDKTDVFVILLDDFDNFTTVSEIAMTLKATLSMDSIKDTGILLGMALPSKQWSELTSLERHHPLSRYFLSRVTLAPLSENEFKDTVIKSLAGTGVSFQVEVISKIYKYTEGHPFEMQVLCHNLFDNHFHRRVEVDVWEKALQDTLNDLGNAVFEGWFRKASSQEAKVLRIIAQAETPISVKKIQEIIRSTEVGVSTQNVTKYLQRLAGKNLLNKSGRGLYHVSDKMFRTYIRSSQEPE